ncbi:BTB/POZ domain-containing protein At5g48130 isoform X2 [Carica papaya]|uniref:BTB/POZ domain-containing protein At5g48130 isoform X2 n=1 Tax=Carica papaya TaxID=3649 RepID=UPI000B8C80D0|nr:BTB/POZ domain-containing protein At5g48130 isoform X2 [Carica papaya]
MEVASSKDSSVSSSPFSSPNISALLKIKVLSWSQETGLPVSIQVRVCGRTFNLHKVRSIWYLRKLQEDPILNFTSVNNILQYPLFSRSGYFNKRMNESTVIDLPEDFPGGPETFEMIALFIYGSSTLIDPFNIAALRCAAEFLEMTEEYSTGNLCERFDLYLNQVVLQSWDDTLIVLQRCQILLPWSEELLIISRCIESLAFMCCMEILDPERRREKPVVTLEALAGQAWSCEDAKALVSNDLWIKDLMAQPFGFFKRVIGSLRRQGMKEKYVSPIMVFYANKWVLLKKTRQYWESSGEKIGESGAKQKVSGILQGILDLLPMGEKASGAIPVGFYFALLARSLELGMTSHSRVKLQDQIASMLHFAQVGDFLFPQIKIESVSSSKELAIMETIFSKYVLSNMDSNHTPARNSIIAESWDIYLSHIAADPKMEPKRFMELIEKVPIAFRQSHDQLYRALNTYLQAHIDLPQEEKGSVCKYLNCQKLSQEACIEAVQNELMPLRLIVQALFIQQRNTHQAFKECSNSFRHAQFGDFSGSLPSSRCPNSNSVNPGDSPYRDRAEPESRTLNILLANDSALQGCEFSRKEYESTSFRIQNLEHELMSLKRSLQQQKIPNKRGSIKVQKIKTYGLENRSMSKKNNAHGQATGCIGSVSFTSQRKYATRLLNIIRRLTLFRGRKSKRRTSANTL